MVIKKEYLSGLRVCQYALIRFIWSLVCLLVLILGSKRYLFLDYRSGFGPVLSALLGFDSYLSPYFTSAFSLLSVVFVLGPDAYSGCRGVATTSTGFHPGTLSHNRFGFIQTLAVYVPNELQS